jgi:GNAT superfamily N-acetyltransferase
VSVRFELCDPWSIAPYAAALGRLERAITYPLGDGRERFFIDHGDEYHPFFSAMGEAYFLVALHDRTPVGVVAGVLKRGERDGRSFESAYVCDLKLDPAHRGHGIAAALLRRALVLSATTPSLRRWRFGYGAAMRGDRGDVLRSARGPLHPAKLTARWASIRSDTSTT